MEKKREYKILTKEIEEKTVVFWELLFLLEENAIDEQTKEKVNELIVYMDEKYFFNLEGSDWDINDTKVIYKCEVSRRVK